MPNLPPRDMVSSFSPVAPHRRAQDPGGVVGAGPSWREAGRSINILTFLEGVTLLLRFLSGYSKRETKNDERRDEQFP